MNCTKYNKNKQNTLRNIQLQHIRSRKVRDGEGGCNRDQGEPHA